MTCRISVKIHVPVAYIRRHKLKFPKLKYIKYYLKSIMSKEKG